MLAKLKFVNYNIDKISFDYQAITSKIGKASLDENVAIRFDLEVGIDETVQKARVLLTTFLESKPETEEQEAEPIPILTVRIAGFFEQDGSLSLKEFRQMCERNGTATIFPFLRAAVADITRIANFGPSLILPLINVHKMLERPSQEIKS